MRIPTPSLAVLATTALAALACGAVQAQDVGMQGGLLRVKGKNENSFSLAAGFTHPVDDYMALSLTYLNEGHPLDHHRDGIASQFWLRTRPAVPGWSFAAGFGADYYFDTAHTANGINYTNDHGWARIYSVQATWHYDSRWYNQIQINRIAPDGRDATTTLMAGVGYRFDGVRGDKLHLDGPSTDDTLTYMTGQDISNSFNSERSRGSQLEYRRAIARYLDWTVSAVNEGDSSQTRRNGIATQLWLIRSLTTHTELGMGAGPYVAFTTPDAPGALSHKKAGLVSVASRYHFNKWLVGEVSWNRVVTEYHRDADMLLLGLGVSY